MNNYVNPWCLSNRAMVNLVNWRNSSEGVLGNHRMVKATLIEFPLLVLTVTAVAETALATMGMMLTLPYGFYKICTDTAESINNDKILAFSLTLMFNTLGTVFIAFKNAVYNNFTKEADTSSIIGNMSRERKTFRVSNVTISGANELGPSSTTNQMHVLQPEDNTTDYERFEVRGDISDVQITEPGGLHFYKRDSRGEITPGFLYGKFF